MTVKAKELALADRLEAQEALKLRGYTATALPEGGVLIDRWGHARGLWHFSPKGFSWTPAGYNEPVCRVDDVEEAVRHTLLVLDNH